MGWRLAEETYRVPRSRLRLKGLYRVALHRRAGENNIPPGSVIFCKVENDHSGRAFASGTDLQSVNESEPLWHFTLSWEGNSTRPQVYTRAGLGAKPPPSFTIKNGSVHCIRKGTYLFTRQCRVQFKFHAGPHIRVEVSQCQLFPCRTLYATQETDDN